MDKLKEIFSAAGATINPLNVDTIKSKIANVIYFLTTVLLILKAVLDVLSGNPPEPPPVVPAG